MTPDRPTDTPPDPIQEKIAQNNPWYVGSQFEWAGQKFTKLIYEKRFAFICACLERIRPAFGPSLRLLDAGCGDGYWLRRLSALPNVELTGVENNPLRVERARQAVAGAAVVESDICSFSIDQPFAAILLNQVIEHVPDDVGLLRHLRTLLHSKGLLIIGAPNEGSRWQQRRRPPAAETDHVHFYRESELRRKIEEAGYTVEQVMREVFYPGRDDLYYWLTARPRGFRLLEWLTRIRPAGCSDFYFACRPHGETHGR